MTTRRSDHARLPFKDSVPSGHDRAGAVMAGCGLALVVARHVLPAESAHLGDTLWIAAFWLLLACVWGVARWRLQWPVVRIDRGDVALVLLATGHVVAALAMAGNRRMAINGSWEWIAVAISVGLLRRWLANAVRWQRFLAVMATIGIVLSGLGVWQYAVAYPALRAQAEELIQLEQQQSGGRLTDDQTARFQQLRSELGQLATESDANVRYALRQRLLASTEPLACFALANTLGGVLAVSLLLLVGATVLAATSRRRTVDILQLALPAALVAFCLLLTKSRTAWVGVLSGAGVSSLGAVRGALLTRRTLRLAVAGLALLAVLIGAAWSAGALDRLVLLEAPKSVRYRVEYWTGAMGVIADHPWVGVGPGNFRQHYLRHKLPGSSEEVLDPHNLLLDVWACGGLAALAGLLLAGGVGISRWRRIAAEPEPAAPADAGSVRSLVATGVVGIGLVWLKTGAIDLQWDTRLFALLCGWIVTAFVVRPVHFSSMSQVAAGVALSVHLLGAGGISMPAVSTTLLLLWLGPALPGAPAAGRRWHTGGVSLGLAVLLVGCLFTAVIPATLCRLSQEAASAVMSQRGDAVAARRFLDQAIAADPIDPQPYVYRAQLEHSLAREQGDPSGANRELALSYLRNAIVRDPENSKTYWLKAQWELEQFERFSSPELIAAAVESGEAAAERDPQNARIVATLGLVYSAAGRPDDARTAAARSLQLDDLNRQLGHFDKLLDEVTRKRLSELSSDG